MFQHQLDQQNKSIAKRISDALAALVPRKATVVRPERNGVWVRFGTENASAPESWFVSTVSGVPSGTSGWVLSIGGGKGLFVATGMPYLHDDRYYTEAEVNALIAVRQPKTAVWSDGTTLSTGGNYALPATGLVTFTGLVPGATYVLSWNVTFQYRLASSSGYASFGVRVSSQAGDAFIINDIADAETNNLLAHIAFATTLTATSGGELAVCPAVQWGGGTITVPKATITARIN